MKPILLVSGLLLLMQCKSQTSYDPPQTRQVSAQGIDSIIANLNYAQIKANLDYLASDQLAGRGTGQIGGELARDFVIKEFQSLGLQPAGDNNSYRQDFSTPKGLSSNVLAILPGTDSSLKNEYIIVGAHYDHLGQDSSGIFNGADDNASGTAAIISIAKSLKQSASVKRSILFIAFGAEEQQTLGSQYWVRNPTISLSSIKFMMNLDMVGKANTEAVPLGILGLQTSPEVDQLASSLLKTKYSQLKVTDVDQVAGASAIHQAPSDHQSFVSQGIPSTFLTIEQGSVSTYHQPTDTSDLIRQSSYFPVIKLATEMTYGIANLAKISVGSSVSARFGLTSFLTGDLGHHKWGCNGVHKQLSL